MSSRGTTVAILGGKGMLGTDLAQVCADRGFEFRIFDLPEFDITDKQQLSDAVDPCDMVVNCAAYTNVDGAESEKELAYKVNCDAVGQLGQLAEKAGKWILHISTDFVFDGNSNEPYIETDKTNPVNEYGRSKLAGEQALIKSGCNYTIMRVEWTYGKAGNNFVKKIITRAGETGKLKVIDDQVGSPTSTKEAAKAICDLIEQKPKPRVLFHFANCGYVSRYEMARFIVEKLGMDVKVTACKSSDFVTPAKRPLNSCFCCDKISQLLHEPIRPWQEPLEEYLRIL